MKITSLEFCAVEVAASKVDASQLLFVIRRCLFFTSKKSRERTIAFWKMALEQFDPCRSAPERSEEDRIAIERSDP